MRPDEEIANSILLTPPKIIRTNNFGKDFAIHAYINVYMRPANTNL